MAKRQIEAGGAFVKISLRDSVKAGLDRVAGQLRAFGGLVSKLGGGLAAAGGAILAPLTAAVHTFSEAGDAIAKMARRTGLTTEAVSGLAHAAGLAGTDVETLEKGIKKLQLNLVDAAAGGGEAAATLAGLGLNARELVQLAPDKALGAVADRLAGIANPAQRASVAVALFGKAGADLIPLLADGQAGLDAMRAQAARLGLTLDAETAAAAEAVNDAFGTLTATLRGVWLQIGAALAPAITDLANRLAEILGGVVAFVKANRELVVLAAKIGVGLVAAGGALLGLGVAAITASLAIRKIYPALAGAAGLARQAAAAITRPFTAARSAMDRLAAGLRAGLATVGNAAAAAGASLATNLSRGLATAATAGGRALAGLAGQVGRLGASLAAGAGAGGLAGVQALGKSFIDAGEAAVRGCARAAQAVGGVVAAGRSAAAAFVRGWTGELTVFTTNGAAAFNTLGRIARAAAARDGAALKAEFRTIWRGLPGAARAAWAAITTGTRQAAARLQAAFATAWVRVRAGGLAALGAIRQAAAGTFGTIARGGRFAFAGLVAGGRTAARGLGRTLGGLAGAAGTLGGLLGDALGLGGSAVLGTVGAALGAIGAALAAILSPAGLLVAAIAGGVAAWLRWSDAGQSAVRPLRDLLASLVQVARDTVGGITAAISAGDLAGAVRIAWQGITAAWWAGMAALQQSFPRLYAAVDRLAQMLGKLPEVWPAIVNAASTAWATIGDKAAALGQWITQIWAGLPAAIAGPLGQLGTGAQAVLGWIGEQFTALLAWGRETFAAIGNAIAAGEWGLAAEIAWLSIKNAFMAGYTWISKTWAEFTTGLAVLWDDFVGAIQNAWGAAVNWVAAKLLKITGAVQSALAAVAKVDPTGLAAKLRDSLTVDVNGAIKALDEDRDRARKQAAADRAGRDAGRAAGLQADLAAADQRLADLQRQRADALDRAANLANEPGGDVTDAQAKLRAALDGLRGAVDTAQQNKGAFDAAARQKSLADGGAAAADVTAAADRQISQAGTNQAAAAFGLAAGGVNSQALRAQMDTAELLRMLVGLTKRGKPLVFRGA